MEEADLFSGSPPASLIAPDPIRVRKILMATDLSECSTRALSYALGIATRYKSQLHLFHCVDPTPYNLLEPGAVQTAREDVQRELEQLVSNLRDRGQTEHMEIKVVVK